jgi:hypothetical protein
MAGTELLVMAAISIGTSLATSLLAPKQKLLPVDKGRNDDIRIQGSEYGTMLPIIYGRARVSGNIIWSDGVQPYVTTTPGRTGGKGIGGGSAPEAPENRYTYKTSLAIALCEGEMKGGLRRVWENTKVIGNFDSQPLPSQSRYEAELSTNTFSGDADIIRDVAASSEYKVSLPSIGSKVTINDITINQAGSYKIYIVYMGFGDKSARLWIDGVSQGDIAFVNSGSVSIARIYTHTHTFTQGTHTVAISKETSSPAPYIDYIYIEGADAMPEPESITGVIDPETEFPSDEEHPEEFYNAQYSNFLPEVIDPNDPNPPIDPHFPSGGGGINNMKFYNGSETQNPDPHIESIDGVGNVPAYRGTCYVVFNQYTIPDGNMPQFTFEVDEGTHDLAEILIKLWARVGLDSSQVDVEDVRGVYVQGLIIQTRTALGDILASLMIAYGFDFVDVGGKIKAVKRGQEASIVIPEADLQAYEDGGEIPLAKIENTFADVNELPRQIDVSYLDKAKDYHQNVQPASKQVGYTEEPQTLTLPLVLTATEAQEIGLRVLYTIHLQRVEYVFSLPPKYSLLTPTDVVSITLPNATHKLRITQFQAGLAGLCRVRAVPESATLYNQVIAGSTGTGHETPVLGFPANTKAVLMDIRPLFSEDTGFGFYAAGCGIGTGNWYGAHLLKEEIIGSGNYTRVAILDAPATIGKINNYLESKPDYDGLGFDIESSLIIDVYNGTLESFTEEEILSNAGLNLAYMGGEVVQFAEAVLQPAYAPFTKRYTVTKFRRGLNGTGGKINTHATGEDFVLFNAAVKFVREQSNQMYTQFNYKAVSIGQPISGAQIITFTTGLENPPPAATNFSLSQVERTSVEGISFIAIRGTFQFGSYVGGQKAKVFIMRPSESSFTNTGILVSPDANNTGSFEIPAAVNGTYYVQVVVVSPFDHQLPSTPVDPHPIAGIDVSAPLPVPTTPSAPVADTFDGQRVTWRWTAATSTDHAFYRIIDQLGNIVVNRVDSNYYSEQPQALMYRRVVAVSNRGIPSSPSLTGTFTLPTPPVVTGIVTTYDGYQMTYTWTFDPKYTYEIGNGSFAVIGQSDTGQWIETSVGAASFTRYIRAKWYGVAGAWSSAINITVAPPPAPTSVAFDLASATPFDVPVLIALPAGTDRRLIRQTVVEVLKASDNSVISTMPYDGVAESALISGHYATAATRTIKVRAYYVNAFTTGASTVTASSYTFPAVGDTDITDPYILGNQIHDGVINTAAFASTIRPVQLYSASTTALPVLPDTNYPIGAQLYWTNAADLNNRKLWRNDAGVWTKRIDAVDITANSITAGQIAVGAIGADQIAAGAIRADKIAVGVLSDNLILNSSFEDFDGSFHPVGWTLTEGAGIWASSTFQRANGNYSLAIQNSGNLAISSVAIPVTAGEKYSFRMKLFSNATLGVYYARINEYNSSLTPTQRYIGSATAGEIQGRTSYTEMVNTLNGANELLANANLSTLNGGNWIQKEGVYTVPAGVKFISVTFQNYTGANDYLLVDEVSFRKQIQGVLIENGTITGINVAANTITGTNIAADTITVRNLVVAGMSDNLILNSSFEQVSGTGFPEAWATYGAITTATSILIGGSGGRAANLPIGAGITSKVVPVTPGSRIALRYKLWASAAVASGNMGFLFKAAMPAGSYYMSHTGASVYDTFVLLPSISNMATTPPTTFIETLITVPAGMYWMAFYAHNTSGTVMYIDDLDVKREMGDAFIANLKASKITADTIGAGLVFADQIRQSNHVAYQNGSTYTPSLGWNYTYGTQVTYEQDTDELVYTGTTGNDSTSSVVTDYWQKLKAGTNGYFEFASGVKSSTKKVLGGLIAFNTVMSGDFPTAGAGAYNEFVDYYWQLDTNGNAYCCEADIQVFNSGSFATGDLMRVAVEDGYVRYRKNGKLIYTSPRKPSVMTYVGNVNPDFLGVVLFTAGVGNVGSVRMRAPALVQEGTGQGWRLNPLAGSSVFNQEPIWIYPTGNVPADLKAGSSIIKNGGTAAWNTSVASEQTIGTGDGWIQGVPTTGSSTAAMIGLTSNTDWANPAYATLNYAIFYWGGALYVYENGIMMTGGAITSGSETDVLRVSIEGTKVKYRRNGAVFYESPNSASLSYPLRGKVCLYEPNTGFTNVTMTASSAGAGEFNSGIKIRGERLEDLLRATQAIRADNRYRGNDSGRPSDQITSVGYDTYFTSFEDDMCYVGMFLTTNDFKTNPTKNMDSIAHTRVRVYNKFGERITRFTDSSFSFNGRGVCFSGFLPREYADAKQEAVFSFELENLYGYSQVIWFSDAAWKSTGGRVWTAAPQGANISNSAPQWMSRNDCPSNCAAVAISESSVQVTWSEAINYTATNHEVWYRSYQSKGYEGSATNGGWTLFGSSGTGTLTVTGLLPNKRYEFMTMVNGQANTWSNIAYCRTFAVAPLPPTYAAPNGLAGSNATSGQIDLTWTTNGGTNYTTTQIYYMSGVGVPDAANTLLGSDTDGTMTHSGLGYSQTYSYRARNQYTIGGTQYSGWSNAVTITSQAAPPPATLPTNVVVNGMSEYSVKVQWSINGGATSHRVQLDEDGGDWSTPLSDTTVGSSGNSKTISGLLSGAVYQARVSADGGTNWSQTAIGSTWDYYEPPPNCVDVNSLVKFINADESISRMLAGDVLKGMRLSGVNTLTGEKVIASVKKVFKEKTDIMYVLTAENGFVLRCSESHPVISSFGDINGKPARFYKKGDTVLLDDDVRIFESKIISLEVIKGDFEIITYEMESKEHTFVSDGFVSHNRDAKL